MSTHAPSCLVTAAAVAFAPCITHGMPPVMTLLTSTLLGRCLGELKTNRYPSPHLPRSPPEDASSIVNILLDPLSLIADLRSTFCMPVAACGASSSRAPTCVRHCAALVSCAPHEHWACHVTETEGHFRAVGVLMAGVSRAIYVVVI